MARKSVFGKSLDRAMRDQESDASHGSQSEEDAAPKRPSRPSSSPTLTRALASIENEDRQATRSISPSLIRMSPIADRLDVAASIDELAESIREHGQKVPILVRRLEAGDYEVVYGRRRLLACKKLGIDVRAMVSDLSQEEALVAQGLENTARLETSFIERALFVYRIIDQGYSVSVVQQAVSVDKSLISKMKAIVSELPEPLIRKIGPAHGVGRRQWEALGKACAKAGSNAVNKLIKRIPEDIESKERLSFALSELKPSPAKSKPEEKVITDGIKARRSSNMITLSASTSQDDAFLTYLEARLDDLMKEFLSRKARDD